MGKYVVAMDAADKRRTSRLVAVTPMKGKGVGVLAKRDIPAFTMVGPYPGERFTMRAYHKRRSAGVTDGKFAVDFWRPEASGIAREGYVVDPGDRAGNLRPRFQGAVAPLVNEPGHSGRPNLIWVWNLPKYRLEQWTFRPVRRGEELTLCYGNDGGYSRSYKTACQSRPGEVEPELHVVTRPGAKPVAWSAMGPADVQAANRALKQTHRLTGAPR